MTRPNMAWADNLRVLAIFGVVIIHAAAPCLYQFGNIEWLGWQIANFYDSLFRFCVPMFLMLTGALLLQKDYPLKDFLKKRFVRIVLPFAFWTLVYILYNIAAGESENTWHWVAKQLVSGAAFHLWYVYTLIGICLFLPFIGPWIRNSSENEILLYLSIWLVTFALRIPVLSSYAPEIDLTYFTGYLGYVILGYYLSQKKWNKPYLVAFACIFCGAATTILGTALATAKTGRFSGLFYQYLTPNVVMLSTGVFILIRHYSGEKTSPVVSLLGRYSYGIYLGHVLVLEVLQKSGIDWRLFAPPAGILITAALCLPITLALVWLLSKMPYGKYISG